MKTLIQQRLSEIEEQHAIRILFACESGSRAWGFPSPDSDYDVRFIYLSPIEKYLSVNEKADHINFPLSGDLDFDGWDLKKALRLISRSNTTPFEWLQSPIIYRETPGFKEELFSLSRAYFDRRGNIHHYKGIANSALASLSDDGTIGIKKLFYIVRPMLAALWCLERNEIAPMNIQPLMDILPDSMRLHISGLIDQKATAAEGTPFKVDHDLLKWIKETDAHILTASGTIPRRELSYEQLNNFFRQAIFNYDYTGS